MLKQTQTQHNDLGYSMIIYEWKPYFLQSVSDDPPWRNSWWRHVETMTHHPVPFLLLELDAVASCVEQEPVYFCVL